MTENISISFNIGGYIMERAYQKIIDEFIANEQFIDSILNDIDIVLEDSDPTKTTITDNTPKSDKEFINGASVTGKSTSANNKNSSKTTATDSDADKNDEDNPQNDNKEKSKFAKKLEAFITFLQNIMQNSLTEFRKNAAYFMQENKKYKEQLDSLKGRKFREGIMLRNWEYDDIFYKNYVIEVNKAYKEYQNVIIATHDAFRSGNENDDWKAKFEAIKNNPYHGGLLNKLGENLKVSSENINAFIAQCRRKFRGNMDEPREHAITESEIRTYIRTIETYNEKAREVNQNLDNLKRGVNTLKGMCDYLKSNISSSDSELRKTYEKEITQITKNLNAFITLTKFQITMNNERAVNANFIVMKAYGMR